MHRALVGSFAPMKGKSGPAQECVRRQGETRGGKDDRVGRRFVASGPSRRWEKRWMDHGHLRVCKWQRVEEN